MFKDTVIAYYRAHPGLAAPYREELRWLESPCCRDDYMAVYPYPFCGNSLRDAGPIAVRRGAGGLPYVMHGGRRLYFPARWGNAGDGLIAYKYRYLCMEQHPESPHCYLTPALRAARFDTLIDAGCAEGMLALEMIGRVERAVLVECDPAWLPALESTFTPWKHKVTFVCKKLGDTDGADSITLQTLARKYGIRNALVKLDIEGYERQALAGAGDLKEYARAVLCCTYHRADDAAVLAGELARCGYRPEFSRGYMLFASPPDWLPLPEPPYFRKGLVRAE